MAEHDAGKSGCLYRIFTRSSGIYSMLKSTETGHHIFEAIKVVVRFLFIGLCALGLHLVVVWIEDWDVPIFIIQMLTFSGHAILVIDVVILLMYLLRMLMREATVTYKEVKKLVPSKSVRKKDESERLGIGNAITDESGSSIS